MTCDAPNNFPIFLSNAKNNSTTTTIEITKEQRSTHESSSILTEEPKKSVKTIIIISITVLDTIGRCKSDNRTETDTAKGDKIATEWSPAILTNQLEKTATQSAVWNLYWAELKLIFESKFNWIGGLDRTAHTPHTHTHNLPNHLLLLLLFFFLLFYNFIVSLVSIAAAAAKVIHPSHPCV